MAGVVLTLRDVSDRKVLEGELRHRAFHDSLTNLANRVALRRSGRSRLDSHAPAPGPMFRSCWWTSMTSRSSTTPSGTPPATTCWCSWPTGWCTACGRATPSPASAATSSRCASRSSPAPNLTWPSTAQRILDVDADALLGWRCRCRRPGQHRRLDRARSHRRGRPTCCVRPTSPCTRPRTPARAPTSSSSPASIAWSSPASSGGLSWKKPSRATSCSCITSRS